MAGNGSHDMSPGIQRTAAPYLVLWAVTAAALSDLSPVIADEVAGAEVESEITVTEEMPERPRIPSTFGSSEISDWYAPDSATLIIDTYAHGKFKATLTTPCQGIRSAQTLGFSTLGPYELDESTRVTLPDGQQCFFKDLSGYTDEEEKQDRETRARKPVSSE